MTRIFKICLFIPVIFVCAFFFNINAAAESNYYFNKYDVKINVGEDNTYTITEKIQCHFSSSSHGIYRKIPIVNKVKRLDGTTSKNKAYISDVYCNKQYSESVDGNYYVLKIGDPNSYADTDTEYVISYKYDLGKDDNSDYDEFYYNLYGTEWEGSVKSISFKINMPKKFDSSKLGFSSGSYGSTDSEYLQYSVKGNTIYGTYNSTLDAGEGLTVRCELPDGYFSKAESHFDYSSLIFFIISFASFIGVVVIFVMTVRSKKKYAPTVEFYPPEGLLCTDLACVIDGKVTKQQLIAVVFHLAEKGYIKIQDGYDTSASVRKKKKSSYYFIKLRDYDGDNFVESKVFNGLFSLNDNFANITTLGQGFNRELDDIIIKNYKHKRFNGEINFYDNVFKKSFITPKTLSKILLFVCGLFGVILNQGYFGSFTFDQISNLFDRVDSSITFILVIVMLFVNPAVRMFSSNIGSFFKAGITILVGTLFFNREQYSSIKQFTIISSLVFIAVGFILINKMQNIRTEYGKQLYAKTMGFKNFLLLAEKPMLEELVEKNPNYFFDILPYSFALGVSKKWIDKFTDIYVAKPDWYVTDYYSYSCWNNIYCNTYSCMMKKVSGGSGFSSSSGGGFSGGGSGGGGGGSW